MWARGGHIDDAWPPLYCVEHRLLIYVFTKRCLWRLGEGNHIQLDPFRAKTKRFPTCQGLAERTGTARARFQCPHALSLVLSCKTLDCHRVFEEKVVCLCMIFTRLCANDWTRPLYLSLHVWTRPPKLSLQ